MSPSKRNGQASRRWPAATPAVPAILSRPRRRTFGVLLDLREVLQTVRQNARKLETGPRRVNG